MDHVLGVVDAENHCSDWAPSLEENWGISYVVLWIPFLVCIVKPVLAVDALQHSATPSAPGDEKNHIHGSWFQITRPSVAKDSSERNHVHSHQHGGKYNIHVVEVLEILVNIGVSDILVWGRNRNSTGVVVITLTKKNAVVALVKSLDK